MADQGEIPCFKSLFTRNYDVTLICQEKEVRASKSMLKNSCPYFEGLLSGSFPEGKSDVVKIDNTSYDVLTAVVNYATFKQFAVKDWDISKWQELFSTAHEYNFQDLLQHASEVFDINEFDLLTVLETFPLFIKLNLTQVMDKVWSHIDTYADNLLGVKNRQQFLAWPQQFVEALILRDNLNVSEVPLLDAIAEWLKKHANVDLANFLNHIHWNEISDKDLRKQLWLGWSKDTSYKDKKPRCLSVPLTFQQTYILPDHNIAQYGASEALLQKSHNRFPPHNWQYAKERQNIQLSRPFAINTIKFRLISPQHYAYKVEVTTTNGNRVIVTPESMTGCSYQELYFEPKIVTRIDIMSGFVVDCLECMYSTNIPVMRDSYVLAEKNMILETKNASSFSFQHIDYQLLQKCYVSSLALYLGCDEDHQFELFESYDCKPKPIPITNLSVVMNGSLIVVVLQFEELLVCQVTIKSNDGIIHIVKAECPASKSLISKATAMKSE